MHTSPQHSSSHRKHAHKKKTSKGHALLLPNPGTLLPVMAMEKEGFFLGSFSKRYDMLIMFKIMT
jgi:hypothetical protein